jgi:hypothetical protein
MQPLAFLVTWAILGTGITLWLSSLDLVMFLAVTLGVIVGLIVNSLAWVIFSNGSSPFNF